MIFFEAFPNWAEFDNYILHVNQKYSTLYIYQFVKLYEYGPNSLFFSSNIELKQHLHLPKGNSSVLERKSYKMFWKDCATRFSCGNAVLQMSCHLNTTGLSCVNVIWGDLVKHKYRTTIELCSEGSDQFLQLSNSIRWTFRWFLPRPIYNKYQRSGSRLLIP